MDLKMDSSTVLMTYGNDPRVGGAAGLRVLVESTPVDATSASHTYCEAAKDELICMEPHLKKDAEVEGDEITALRLQEEEEYKIISKSEVVSPAGNDDDSDEDYDDDLTEK